MSRLSSNVTHEINILEGNREWADWIADFFIEESKPEIAREIRSHAHFVILSPHGEMSQLSLSQVDLAVEAMRTVEILMRILNAPAAALRTAKHIYTHSNIIYILRHISPKIIVNTYVKLWSDGDDCFSNGMHSLGYPDAQIPYSFISPNMADNVMREFLTAQLINDTWKDSKSIAYKSIATNDTYLLERIECQRFLSDGDLRFNKNGVWTFKSKVS